MSASEDARRAITTPGRVHFVGIAGTGMSGLAAYRALSGQPTSGSDREFDRRAEPELRASLEELGIEITPQDGSGARGADVVVTSTAVEADIPDLATARAAGRPLVKRSNLLAAHLDGPRSVAIAGTSGKSTTTALTFTALEAAGAAPALLTGAGLAAVRRRSGPGNAWVSEGPLVAEADESDGSLIEHHPAFGVLLNVHRDHMEADKVVAQLATFRDQCRDGFAASTDASLGDLGTGGLRFGTGPDADLRATDITPDGYGTRARVDGHAFRLPLPGLHNLENALAALAVVRLQGLDVKAAMAGLETFEGLDRRFQRLGTARGITVVDDYAHNPEKLAAVLRTAQEIAPRVHLFWQPHGFGPLRFLGPHIAREMAALLRRDDSFTLPPVYFAGGTTDRSVDSELIVEDPVLRSCRVLRVAHRDDWVSHLRRVAQEGDLALITGARDPSLGAFARSVLEGLGQNPG